MSGDREQLIPVLKKSSLAAGMSDEEVAELLASAQVHLREYPKGQIVFHEGDMPKSLYILLAGEVHILKDTFSGRRIFLSEINEPGDMFGEVYEVLKQPYDMYVETVTPVRLLEISSDLFSLEAGGKLSRSALKIQRNLMRIFARKAYFMHNKIKVLASGSLREKIIRFLFIELQGKRELELTGSREFMAAYLAVTRPSLSRELSAMQREGIIAVDGKCVKVLDMERFEEYL
ncbi:Crp/Fnr family transcriptional regulator [Selenomonas ruminantium]|uniref:cAMP-binding domain of CRP or a regulatory subunit of cAMP-dependent protein kinases n=1 Tax=Selenomonas ruminantium TaxID=971 RepID=A0A1I0XIA0_SELRU|nr:Crp/Fnr family transcriptional regulator [Selenomonas ruminantium]SFB00742.1 cAMP-binding domain of CRP or a regulatory subunit of cAMP-dependent protein kinases [Selenomonas ruminantium]